MPRLFFALWPDDAIAGRLHAAAKMAHAACGGRIMRRESLHVTLAFLGEVAPPRMAAAEAVAAAVGGRSFLLELDRLECWKHNRIAWAGCTAAPPALMALARDLAAGLRGTGFALDARPFAAHATLLRQANCAAPLPALPEPIRWPTSDFALVESRPSLSGSRYEVVRRWPLGEN
jgi:RNA 2',3'-cyclic 3'-phosphodiesterase